MTVQNQLDAGPLRARRLVEDLGQSKIREVANAGMDQEGILAFWYGEPDAPTPDFINNAAIKALQDGETFYTENLGILPLRQAIADYMSGLYGIDLSYNRIAVTASGMAAINLIQQVVTEAGDNLVVSGPVWPNLVEATRIMNGEPRMCPVRFGNEGWSLDLDELFSKVDGRTRAIMINSPSNPTGWVMEGEQQKAVLDFARERGIWVIADEVYARLVYDRPFAPSFLQQARPDDRLLVVNSFSKSWCMTGWRLGWITAPEDMMDLLEKMIEFHFSCSNHFAQVGALTAIRDGEGFVKETVERYRQARDLAVSHLEKMPKVRVTAPAGAFYLFFEVEGMRDSVATCKDIIRKTGVGMAPGAAFGPEYEGFIRLCFASSLDRLEDAMQRLAVYFSENDVI